MCGLIMEYKYHNLNVCMVLIMEYKHHTLNVMFGLIMEYKYPYSECMRGSNYGL